MGQAIFFIISSMEFKCHYYFIFSLNADTIAAPAANDSKAIAGDSGVGIGFCVGLEGVGVGVAMGFGETVGVIVGEDICVGVGVATGIVVGVGVITGSFKAMYVVELMLGVLLSIAVIPIQALGC
jgi:hypothetical protein